MPELTEKQIEVVEDWVNDEGAILILTFYNEETGEEHIPAGQDRNTWVHLGRWNAWVDALQKEVEEAGEARLPETFLDDLVEDIADWEHNGNLHHWGPDETNDFGMSRWRLEEMGQ